jgi:hypothetical protein
MLDADVTSLLIRERIRLCEDACDDFIEVSQKCADTCLVLPGDGDVTRCFLAAWECVKVGDLTLRALSWTTSVNRLPAIAALEACVEACTASVAACQRLAETRHSWAPCTESCHRMSNACTELLVALETPL